MKYMTNAHSRAELTAPRISTVDVTDNGGSTSSTSHIELFTDDELESQTQRGFKSTPFRSELFKLLRVTSTEVQPTILAVSFLCGPGLFVALMGLGAAGLDDPTPVNNSYIATYASTAVVSFFAGPIVDRIGFRAALILGAAGENGKHIAYNFAAFNLGTVLGRSIIFGQNIDSVSASVSDATCYIFVGITALGILLSMFVVKVEAAVRSDNSRPTLPPSVKSFNMALYSFLNRLRADPSIIALFPMMFASNIYLPYVFNDINLTHFNFRTRALNVMIFYAAGIPGARSAGSVLDIRRLSQRTRLIIGIFGLFLFFNAVFVGAYAWQRGSDRADTEEIGFHLIDCTEMEFVPALFLIQAFGFTHFVFQSTIYWFMALLSDKSETASASDFSGFYKSLQGVGLAVAWAMSNKELSFNTDLAIRWGFVIGSVFIATPVLLWQQNKAI
ncbi:hypothetical protein F4778DRAFT_789047 [Xylariomycetidae sp. FL2044]|nr:hypothetical protein F4778DRAFT_789047 [Xylariomycetidae sp. FL2044]